MMGSSFSNSKKLCGKPGKSIGALREFIHSLLCSGDNFSTTHCGGNGTFCASTTCLLNLHSGL